MAGRFVPMRIGDVEVLVEATQVPGSEPTSALDTAQAKMVDVLHRAQDAILEVGRSTAEAAGKLATVAVARPEKVEVEFGLGFSVKGNVIVAAGGADASLKVKLVYDTSKDE